MEKGNINPDAIKAYEDVDFLKTDTCRAVRLQLEFLRPETIMSAQRIRSTIVLFGSARILPPDVAREQLAKAVEQLAATPGDAARAATTEKYRASEAPIDSVLESVGQQTEQTVAFLETLTDYNRAIAEYATTVLPAGTSSDKLVAALVTKP